MGTQIEEITEGEKLREIERTFGEEISIPRQIIAEFYKSAGGRLTLESVTTLESVEGSGYLSRAFYDVDYSRRFGYLWHESGGGGRGSILVSGIYFITEDIVDDIKEESCKLCNRKARKRNHTRRLKKLPKVFDLLPRWDLLDWLEHRAIQDDAVWCSECKDYVSGQECCEHCWWCNKNSDYSTPDEPCGHSDKQVCWGGE